LRPQSATITITHAVTAAAGVFAPGHVGELTQYLPFELVDDVLEQTKTVQRRLRDLPSRTGVYFLLALAMFPRLGYARVWDKLTAGLAGLALPTPSEKALRDLRRRLGPAPMRALFEVVAGPLAQPRTPGVRFGGLRTVAFDGLNSLKVPDTDRNRCWMGRIRYRMGWAGYPTLRLMTLAETGTRALLGAAIGSAADRDEASLARRLLPLLRPGMLLLLDRGFDADAFLAQVDATGAMLLARAKSTRNPQVLEHLPDGSYLSCLNGLTVRIIEAALTITGADGSSVSDTYRASFTAALEAARDQLTAARGICPDGPADLPGAIGRAVLAALLPARRPRYSARKVKCSTSRYLNRDDGRPAASTAVTAIDIVISTPPIDIRPRRGDRSAPRPSQPATRRQRVTAIMSTGPRRPWSGAELAAHLQVKPRNLLTQLAEWTRFGFLTRTGAGTYTLAAPATPP
jgi:Insertion element 4 transposase N-terminal